MILLNWLLALGALAFTVPLAIHLLFRNRFELIDWGAMQFLESVVRLNRRRMQLRNWLLLLIRCVIPILLAFCLARPVLTGWQQPRGDQAVAMVLVLDTSYSMAAGRDDGRRRTDTAVDAARQITDSLGRGSEITLLTSDGAVRSGDPQSIGSELAAVTVGGGPLELDSLVSRAVRLSADSSLANRQIVLLSDNAASDYSQAVLDALPAIGERLRLVSPQPDLSWVDPLGQFPQPSRNRRISRADPAVPVAVAGQVVPWLIEARVEGMDPASVTLHIHVNGQVRDQRTVPVRNGIATAMVPLQLDDVGRHGIEVAVSVSDDSSPSATRDDFPADDRVYRDFWVIDPIGVWLIDGNPSGKPLESDTDFLGIALSPFSLSEKLSPEERPGDLFRTRKVRQGRLRDDLASEFAPRVVVLADVARPSPADCRWLADFVEHRGGTLVVFAGPSLDPQWYDTHLVSGAGTPLLPYRFGEVRSTVEAVGIDDTRLTYPPLAPFSTTEKGTLSSVQVNAWRDLIARDPSAADSQSIIRLESGQPLMAVASIGYGRVMQVATTSDNSWTTLPLRPVFVPLMQRLLAHLALGGETQMVRQAGEPIVLSGVVPGGRWTVMTPDGQMHTALASEAGGGAGSESSGQQDSDPFSDAKLSWSSTRLAGAYRFQSDDGETIWATVNVPAADLRLAAVESSIRQEAAKQMGAEFYGSLDAYLQDDANRRFGRAIWHYVLLALLAAMILEPVVQQSRVRRV